MATTKIPPKRVTITDLKKIKKLHVNLKSMSKAAGINYSTIQSRIRRGNNLNLEDSLKLEQEIRLLRDELTRILTK